MGHTIITPHHFSFYLQSHDSLIGTARSGHYVVIHNGSAYSLDQLQNIINKLCFRDLEPPSICPSYSRALCRYPLRPSPKLHAPSHGRRDSRHSWQETGSVQVG